MIDETVSKESGGEGDGVTVTGQLNELELETDGTESIVNQYKVVGKIGEGAFGQVLKCVNRYTNEPFAMKVFSRSFLKKKKEFIRTGKGRPKLKTALEDVEREIAIMKKIRHPNIVQLHELIDDPEKDTLYLVIEYLPKGQVMFWNNKKKHYRDSSGKVLSEERSRRCLADCIKGLDYLHRQSIVHRDLKPENILIGSNDTAKLADFGVSQKLNFSGEKHQKLTKIEGTTQFTSPEAIKEREFDGFKADIWALGVCLLTFLTGKLPFWADDIEDLYTAIETAPVKLPGGIGKEPARLLMRLLDKEPSTRITMKELKEDPWVNLGRAEPEANIIQLTQAEIDTAVTVRISFLLAVRLKLLIIRWRRRVNERKERERLGLTAKPSSNTTNNHPPPQPQPSSMSTTLNANGTPLQGQPAATPTTSSNGGKQSHPMTQAVRADQSSQAEGATKRGVICCSLQ